MINQLKLLFLLFAMLSQALTECANEPGGPFAIEDAALEQCVRDILSRPDGQLEVTATTDDKCLRFRPQRLIVATGAYESIPPFPGWTLPGVMATGAAQTLLRAYRVAPGRRVLIAGNGPLNLQLACELASAGVQIVRGAKH